MSRDALEAAKQLTAPGQWRGSVNRSYYVAYCAVTAALVAHGLSFAHGWNNPAHDQLPDLVGNNLPLPQNTRRSLRKVLRILRRARESADYRPGATIDRALALDCIRYAIIVLHLLEVSHD